MFPVVLPGLFITVTFPAGLHRRSVNIPFGHILANGVFLFRKLLADGLFAVREFFIPTDFVGQLLLTVFFPVRQFLGATNFSLGKLFLSAI